MTNPNSDTPKDTSIVYIGQKATTAYVMAAISQFQKGYDKVSLKARGRAISRCVDVAEVLTKRFMSGEAQKKEINISTEKLESKDGSISNVSAIEIIIEKIPQKTESENVGTQEENE